MGRGKNTKARGLVTLPPASTRTKTVTVAPNTNQSKLRVSDFAKTSSREETRRLIKESSYVGPTDIKAIFGSAKKVKEYLKGLEELGLLSAEDFSELKDIVRNDKGNENIKDADLTYQAASYIWNYLDIEDFHAVQMEKTFGIEEKLRSQYERASERLEELDDPDNESSKINDWGTKMPILAALDNIKRDRDLSPDERLAKAAELASKYVTMGSRVESRHDKAEYIVYKIIKKSRNFIPTMSNTSGVDFFVNGRGWDLKTTDSPTRVFKEKHPDWRQAAIDNPEEVARDLYQEQGSDRFTDTPRLFIIDSGKLPDESSREKALEEALENVSPIPIDFEYKHKGEKEKRQHSTSAMVIVL